MMSGVSVSFGIEKGVRGRIHPHWPRYKRLKLLEQPVLQNGTEGVKVDREGG